MPRGATRATGPATGAGAPEGGQRARILSAAAELIAAHGVEGMTMRQLARACGLNIATLYHYFGSKSDLLGAIVEQRRYDAGLRATTLPVDTALAPRPRFAGFFTALATGALGEVRLWRLLVGESLRDDAVALAEVQRLSGALEEAVDRWLGELFPELGGDPARPDRSAATPVVTGQLVALFLEEMLLGDDGGRPERLARRADATAAVLFPGPA